jgi:hypothetical protein
MKWFKTSFIVLSLIMPISTEVFAQDFVVPRSPMLSRLDGSSISTVAGSTPQSLRSSRLRASLPKKHFDH